MHKGRNTLHPRRTFLSAQKCTHWWLCDRMYAKQCVLQTLAKNAMLSVCNFNSIRLKKANVFVLSKNGRKRTKTYTLCFHLKFPENTARSTFLLLQLLCFINIKYRTSSKCLFIKFASQNAFGHQIWCTFVAKASGNDMHAVDFYSKRRWSSVLLSLCGCTEFGCFVLLLHIQLFRWEKYFVKGFLKKKTIDNFKCCKKLAGLRVPK